MYDGIESFQQGLVLKYTLGHISGLIGAIRRIGIGSEELDESALQLLVLRDETLRLAVGVIHGVASLA